MIDVKTSIDEQGRNVPRIPAKLKLVNLSKFYGPVRAVDGANLEVHEGEFLTLLGPSGSGKTTLLMMVAGLVMPSYGEVWLDEKLATYKPPHKRDIGMVFQNYALFPHMTVAENIAFPLRMRHVPDAEIRQRVQTALELIRLPDIGRRHPWQLSGGQQQRVALARGLVYNPSVLLMDEPLGALDKKLRDEMQLEIKQLQTKLRITVLYVTHDQGEALTMSDRICLMHLGKIEQLGTPDELYRCPRSWFVASFIGESNFLKGRLTRSQAISSVQLPGGTVIRAPQNPELKERQEVLVMVRPEDLCFLNENESAENTVGGIVRQVVFMGEVNKYWVEVDGGPTLVVKQLAGVMGRTCSVRQRVLVGWPSAAGVLLPEMEDRRL